MESANYRRKETTHQVLRGTVRQELRMITVYDGRFAIVNEVYEAEARRLKGKKDLEL
jgi:hypothetical protein